MTVKHNYQSATANDGTKEVSSTRWNAAHVIDILDLVPQSPDPSAPADGNFWYTSVTGQFKAKANGVVSVIGGGITRGRIAARLQGMGVI